MAEEKVVVIQKEGDRLEHGGELAVYGDHEQPALRHDVGGQVVHSTDEGRPLVHMVAWEETKPCNVDARVTGAGDAKAPVEVKVSHAFANDHQQTLRVQAGPNAPIHHALRLDSPLEVSFCNSWDVTSDYRVEVVSGKGNPVFSVRLWGRCNATPRPCPQEPPGEAPPVTEHPPVTEQPPEPPEETAPPLILVANTNSLELHRRDCRYAKRIHPRNREEVTGTAAQEAALYERDELPAKLVADWLKRGFNGCYFCLREIDTDSRSRETDGE